MLKDLDDNSVDSIVTDPPYGYSFMGKDWDKALPSIDMWKECVRVLKPGGFAFIMSAPRSDVHSRMCLMLEEAGFRIDFTPIAWTYATGFPKASNIGKMVDKREGKERKVIGKYTRPNGSDVSLQGSKFPQSVDRKQLDLDKKLDITEPASDKAKELDGSYGGFQPKPAWENVIVCMKPLSEKGYLDQAMKNGKGVTWLDDCRVPYKSEDDISGWSKSRANGSDGFNDTDTFKIRPISAEEIQERCVSTGGRFPANLLVQDDVLNNGKTTKSTGGLGDINVETKFGQTSNRIQKPFNYQDEGSFSRYYDLDAWWEERIQELPLNVQATYPFLIVPKASKSEKNKGMGVKGTGSNTYNKKCLSCGKWQRKQGLTDDYTCKCDNPDWETPTGNVHPTVKPISLMSYLITLGSREDELVLDPFVGSGTTCIAAKLLNRKYIGMEMDDEYVVIAQERIKSHEPEKQQHKFF